MRNWISMARSGPPAEHGYLYVETRPERHNTVKVVLFLDVGGSMDAHVKVVEELFSAAQAECKHLEYYYFHNRLYGGVWRDNRRQWDAQTPTHEVLRTYGPDYKCIFVGDASMSPYEIAYPGGANEHWNAEAGQVWLARARDRWPSNLWINPAPEKYLGYTHSIQMIREIFEGPAGADDLGGARDRDERPHPLVRRAARLRRALTYEIRDEPT